jgi:hypothetical protein
MSSATWQGWRLVYARKNGDSKGLVSLATVISTARMSGQSGMDRTDSLYLSCEFLISSEILFAILVWVAYKRTRETNERLALGRGVVDRRC